VVNIVVVLCTTRSGVIVC